MQPSCEEIQARLVGGELQSDLASHVGACDECRFVAALSRRFAGTAASGTAGSSETAAGMTALGVALSRALETGEPLRDRYRLEQPLGAGGQGLVYRARDLETDEIVALKLVRPRDASALEVANARRVRHANVCRIYHTERHGGLRLIVMEHVEGGTLADALPALDRRRALRIFEGICCGVEAAHEAGVLHLDLKPQNVLLRDGETPIVTDFGLSARLAAGEPASAPGGTPAYMAPEQRRGLSVDARTDVYALGRILGDLLRGAPGRLAGVLRRATAEDPARRYASPRALLGDLQRVLGRPRRLVRGVAALIAGGAALLVLALMVPPPAARRAVWDTALRGRDPIPSHAWNIAENRRGRTLPRATASHAGFGCGQSLPELLDGLTEYGDWMHGFAFPPVRDACISLDLLGRCGAPEPTDHLCERREDGGSAPLDERLADIDRLPEDRRLGLGQWIPAVPCGERWVTVELERPRPILAVRAWHHGEEHVPRRFRILAGTGQGWREVFKTVDNDVGQQKAWHAPMGMRGYGSGPVTSQFLPVVTDRVRLVMDTCSAGGPGAGLPAGHGWLYELEIFAVLPRYEAWYRAVLLRP